MPVLIDNDTREAFAWDANEATIGRTPDNTVQIRLPGVSRAHCRIVRRGANYTLQDLGSKNGTALNGKPVTGELLLQPGDTVFLGKRKMLFQEHTNAPRAAAPAPAAPDDFVPTIAYGAENLVNNLSVPGSPKAKPSFDMEAAEESNDSPLGFADDSSFDNPMAPPPAAPIPGSAGKNSGKDGGIPCPKCRASNLAGAKACWQCQSPLLMQTGPEAAAANQQTFGGKCPQCKEAFTPGTQICPQCGCPVADRRSVLASQTRLMREEHFWWMTGLAVVLIIVSGYAYFSFTKTKAESGINKTKVMSNKLDRAERTFEEAAEEHNLDRYNQALELYQQVEVMAGEVIESGVDNRNIINRAQSLQRKFADKRRSYALWLEKNKSRIQAIEEWRREKAEQTGEGNAFFHGGWIHPDEFGLINTNDEALFPEEDALLKAIAANAENEIDQKLQAFVRRAWSFQETQQRTGRFWAKHGGWLPLPEQIAEGAYGTRYPESVTPAHFPEVYLTRVRFNKSKELPSGQIGWDEEAGKILVSALFHDTTKEAEAATKSKDIVTLAKKPVLASSICMAEIAIPASKDDHDLIKALVAGETPPVLQLLVKVTGIEANKATKEIEHDLEDGNKFTQTHHQYDYILKFQVIQSRWFRHLPGDDSYLPMFLEKEPETGLYQAAKKALGVE